MRKKNQKGEEDYFEFRNNDKDNLLILNNDDVHDFEYVIASLVDVCNHNEVQAEQCAYLVHYTGKCDIKKGEYSELKKMKLEMLNKGLNVSLI
ncbi:MAG: ATP-dependent Clp protease adaptor ClpS [Bacteroidales bacterium]|jgi:ATP-dependent Clp protease adaptor protein ClpS|nr:ATP-dependent Clp protease adaptor ClpS [Bacteroidales bacterium]